jgi:L-alanine-DL-glutamate epimerase-like enolase superfamily enzyme
MLPIPDRPGLGLTLDMEVVEKYSSGEPFLK